MSVAILAVACSVGPGGSFPDTGGNATVSTTVSTGASTTVDGDETGDSATSDAGEVTADPGTESADSGGATTDPPADSSGAASNDDTTSATEPGSSSDGGSDSAAGTPLDPDLDIPDGGEQCDYPGDLNECPGISVCRFATVEYGLCESCDACGNLNAPCQQGTDCDILFSCYAGHCTNFCTLGTFECGPIEDCLDVGHPTRGVCDPFA